MTGSSYIRKVAVVGAGGHVGKFITEALLATGKHDVTVITRAGSKSKFPEGVAVKQVDYEKQATIVEALEGHDALVITLGGFVDKEIDLKLITAAGEAGVQWILPNEWSPDTANEALIKDIFVFQPKPPIRRAIEDLGKSSYVAISTGFWYEWSLSMPFCYGIDLVNHKATLFDNGETKISTTTWPQVGRAVAGLLGLPISSPDSSKAPSLSDFKNRMVYVKSFTVSQKDMLESAFRVTGTTWDDWAITNEPVHERYSSGIEEAGKGIRVGFAKMLYSRIFFPDGSGNTEAGKGVINDLIGLPEEDLDQATGVALERAKAGVGFS